MKPISWFLCRCAIVGALAAPALAWAAASALPPVQPGATVILPQNSNSIAAKTAFGANLSTQGDVDWVLDYRVDGKNQVLLTLMTEGQYQALSAGKPVQGKALATRLLGGNSSVKLRLAPGRYFVAFTNQSAVPVTLTYRASTLRAK